MADLDKIQFKRTSTSGRWPSTNQLAEGELAINLTDKLIFTNDGKGNIINLGFAKGGNVDGNITTDRDNVMIRIGNDKDLALVKKSGGHGFIGLNNLNDFTIARSTDSVVTPESQFNDIFRVSGQGDVRASVFIGPLEGNSTSATKLQNGRYIFGQYFDGTGDVNGDIKSTSGILYGKDAYHFLDLGGRNDIENVILGGWKPTFKLNDTSPGGTTLFEIKPDATAVLQGRLRAQYIHAPGTTNPDVSAQGAYISWNQTGGQGESSFINNRGQGSGGFYFYNTTDSSGKSLDLLGRIDYTGALFLKGGIEAGYSITSTKNAGSTLTADSAITTIGAFGGGYTLKDTSGSFAGGIFLNGGTLEINLGKTGNGNLRNVLKLDQSSQLWTAGNLITNGYILSNTGLFKSDDYHYIDIGRPTVNRMNLGSYGGIFNFIDSNTNSNTFVIDNNNLSYKGNTLATFTGSGDGVTSWPVFYNSINVNRDVYVGGWIYAPYMTGTAQKAKELETPRTINGVSFNGAANIDVPIRIGTVTNYDGVAWNAPGGVYQAVNPGVDSRIVFHSGDVGGSTPALQIMAGYNNSQLHFRTARDLAGFERSWVKICTEEDGMAIASKRLEQTRSIFGNPYNGTQDVNGNIYIDKDNPNIVLKESGFGDAAQLLFQSGGSGDSNRFVIATSTGGSNEPLRLSAKMVVLAESGKVGISTETPGEMLDVNGNIWANGTISSASDVKVKTGYIYSNDSSHYINLGRVGHDEQVFATWDSTWSFKNTRNNVDVIRFDSGGNINSNGAVRANGDVSGNSLVLSSNGNNGIFNGGGDSASLSSVNMDIGSWWGIGFYDKCFNKRSGYVDTRAGVLMMSGGIFATSNNRSHDFDYQNYAVRVTGDKSGGIALLDTVNFGLQSKFGKLYISGGGADKYWFDANGNFEAYGRITSTRATISSPGMNSETDYENYALKLQGSYGGGLAFLDSNGQYGIYGAFNELRIANGGTRHWTFKSDGSFTSNGSLITGSNVTANGIVVGNTIVSTSGKFNTDGYHYIDIGNSNGGNDRMNFGTFEGMFNFIDTKTGSTKASINATTGTIWTSGDVVANGDVVAFSDKKLKDNLAVIEDPISKVQKLTGYTYDRNDLGNARHVGLIAQDVQKVLPEAVSDNDGTLGVNYNGVIALLIESVKQLTEEVNRLKGELK